MACQAVWDSTNVSVSTNLLTVMCYNWCDDNKSCIDNDVINLIHSSAFL